MKINELNSTYLPVQWDCSGSSLVTGLQRIATLLWSWRSRSRERRALKHLDDRLLGDVGITRQQVATEIKKWFWQE